MADAAPSGKKSAMNAPHMLATEPLPNSGALRGLGHCLLTIDYELHFANARHLGYYLHRKGYVRDSSIDVGPRNIVSPFDMILRRFGTPCATRLIIRSHSGSWIDVSVSSKFLTLADSCCESSRVRVFEMTMNVDLEIERLKTEIGRLGRKNEDGSITVKFGTLFHDDRCANIFEALVGTLRAAKKRKLVTFDAEMLFQGVHDNVDIVLVKPKDVEDVVLVDDVKPKEEATKPVEPVKPVELEEDKKADAAPAAIT